MRAAILDGVPNDPNRPKRTAIKLGNGDGALLVAEVEADLNGTIAALGGWHYTAKFDEQLDVDPVTLAPERSGNNNGLYIEAERQLTSPFGDARGLAAFGRFGIANSEINQLSRYAGAGITYTGLIDTRPDDIAGVAIAHAVNGNTFRAVQAAAGAPVDKAETSIEFTYRAQLTDWLAVQPDAQWIFNPGTDPTLKNAFAVGLRFEVGFGISE